MGEEPITINQRDQATIVRMDDGKVNALSVDFLDTMAHRLAEAVDRDQPIVWTGNGEAFSAGLDLEEVPTLDRGGLRELLENFGQAAREILTAPVPVIAAFDGYAIAGGGIFALTCDYRVAHPEAEIGCTEFEVGIPFPPTDQALFESRLPPHAIRRTIVDPNRASGQQALDLGWVDELAETPLQAGVEASERIGGTNPEAFQRFKQRGNQPVLDAWDAFLDDGFDEYVELLNSKTTQQAVLEGIEKVMN